MKQFLKLTLALMALVICTMCTNDTKAQDITPTCEVRESVEDMYMSFLHVRELTGHNDGKEVELFLASAGLGKGYAWCAAYPTYIYKQHDLPVPKSPAWSPSWFPNSKVIPKEQAQKGDIMGIYFKSKKRIAHVGFIHKWPPGKQYCITVEGNTNGAGSREGDGVYVKRRLKRQVYKVANWIDREPPNC